MGALVIGRWKNFGRGRRGWCTVDMGRGVGACVVGIGRGGVGRMGMMAVGLKGVRGGGIGGVR